MTGILVPSRLSNVNLYHSLIICCSHKQFVYKEACYTKNYRNYEKLNLTAGLAFGSWMHTGDYLKISDQARFHYIYYNLMNERKKERKKERNIMHFAGSKFFIVETIFQHRKHVSIGESGASCNGGNFPWERREHILIWKNKMDPKARWYFAIQLSWWMETLICDSKREILRCCSRLRFLLYLFLYPTYFVRAIFSRTLNVPYRKSVCMIRIFSTAFVMVHVRKGVRWTHLCMQFVIFQIWLCLERIVTELFTGNDRREWYIWWIVWHYH